MLLIKSDDRNTETFLIGTFEELVADLMMGNRAFYRSIKQKNEAMAEVFKKYMMDNVESIFEETADDKEAEKSQQERLNEVLDETQKLIDRLRAKK